MPNPNDNHDCPNNQDNHQNDYHLPKMNSAHTRNNDAWWQKANKMGRPLDDGDIGGGHNEGTWRQHDNEDTLHKQRQGPAPLPPPSSTHTPLPPRGLGSDPDIQGSVTCVDTSLHCVCTIPVFTTTLSVSTCTRSHSAPLHQGVVNTHQDSVLQSGEPPWGAVECWLSWCEEMAAFHCRPAFFIGSSSLLPTPFHWLLSGSIQWVTRRVVTWLAV